MRIFWMVLAYPVVMLGIKMFIAMVSDIIRDALPEGQLKERLFRERWV